MTLAFVDTETTGLDPDLHEIWEVALIVDDQEYLWQLPVDESKADLIALNIGGYHERRRPPRHYPSDPESAGALSVDTGGMRHWARTFADLTWGRHLVGAVPSFDEERLRKLLRANGVCPGWHYHLIDVEVLTVGALYGANHRHPNEPACHTKLPYRLDDMLLALGIDGTKYDKHTALDDARLAREVWRAVTQR